MQLETERLILRRPGARDTDRAVAFFTSDRARHVGGPYTPGAAWRHFAAEVGHWDLLGFGMWAFCARGDDTALGLAGPWCPGDWPETEIGWVTFEGGEGKGFAFEAADAALDHAFGTLGWPTAVSYIDADNARSRTLAERLGARIDPDAPQPRPDAPCLVYRHPARGRA
ncbi:GNAT family N-acetyltransferase [Pseudaestuariivita atlantica]|uniref:GNAT family acetyltransferase n=1 Tax=Pseudaestuariivita atlantica TaxID=1317121 RepID=A0A0L1JRX0_9RHOB|nr:GNAT family N-acetyltransferase [Pseudaestuariivita atlantica]KNG94495.1 GNAT family acetyltransferase [Pseudaestuariivita atlantica]